MSKGVNHNTEKRTPLGDVEFKKELTEVIPHLRAFGRSLCGSPDMADDLVQETLLKAWTARESYSAGTNFKAWAFTILRNHYLSQMRRARFKGEWDDKVAERILSVPSGQEERMALSDLQRALHMLPTNQREALILVSAGGFSYEEAAKIADVAVGTVKSRVARARKEVEKILSSDHVAPRNRGERLDEGPIEDIMSDLRDVSGRD